MSFYASKILSKPNKTSFCTTSLGWTVFPYTFCIRGCTFLSMFYKELEKDRLTCWNLKHYRKLCCYFCPLCLLFIRSSALGSVFVGLLLTASVVATAIKERRYPGNVLSWVNILINNKFFKKTFIYLFFSTYLVLFLQSRYKFNVLIIIRNLNLQYWYGQLYHSIHHCIDLWSIKTQHPNLNMLNTSNCVIN